MRNKEQEMAWRKVIEACMEDVKHHFDDIQQAIEFGCYIQPDNYFVSYIFAMPSPAPYFSSSTSPIPR